MGFDLAGGGLGPSMQARSWFSMAMQPVALYPAEAQQANEKEERVSYTLVRRK